MKLIHSLALLAGLIAAPLADQLSDSDLAAFLAATRQVVDGSVAAMPSHEDFIARHCAAGAN
jgi:hypothetical protein